MSVTSKLIKIMRRFSPASAPNTARPGRIGSATVVLMTITIEEFPIVEEHFGLRQVIPHTPYRVADSTKAVHDLVLVRASSQTTMVAAQIAADAIEDFRPAFIFLIGTAGGHSKREKLQLGDVVVSDYVDFSDYMKYANGQTRMRKIAHDHPSLFLLEHFFENVRTSVDWSREIKTPRPEAGSPKCHKGEIVSGDRLLGDPENPEQKKILEIFDKGLAFEMEAMGIAYAIYRARRYVHYNPQYLVIRGVSDFVDKGAHENQASRERWTPYAVNSATVVAAKVIHPLLDYISRING